MTDKEKAKAYDEAIRKAKIILGCCNSASIITKHTIYDIFPELKESEDEKVRKAIIHFISHTPTVPKGIIGKETMLAWLERQGEKKPYGQRKECEDCQFNYAGECKGSCQMKRGEQKPIFNEHNWFVSKIDGKIYDLNYIPTNKVEPTDYNSIDPHFGKPVDKVEPKFHEGEWITNGDYTWKIVEVKPLDYILQSQDGNVVDDTISHVDEQFHSFTIQDAKHGDVLAYDTVVLIFDHLGTFENRPIIYSWYFADSKKFYGMGTSDPDRWEVEGFYPATKEQRTELFLKMHEAGYEWDAEKKELKKIIDENQVKKNLQDNSFRRMFEKKQEWSEEEIEKAAQEWESKANFNPFYMTMEGDKPTGVKQDITTHKESFKAGVEWILKKIGF